MSLVKACAGVTAKTLLGEMISKMQSAQYRLGIGASIGRLAPAQQTARSKDIAKVLVALSKLSFGYSENIKIMGGGECAFIAPLAFWLFDLKTWIEGDLGSVINSNVRDPVYAQVLIGYRNHAECSAVVASTTYTLPDYPEMFGRDIENQ